MWSLFHTLVFAWCHLNCYPCTFIHNKLQVVVMPLQAPYMALWEKEKKKICLNMSTHMKLNYKYNQTNVTLIYCFQFLMRMGDPGSRLQVCPLFIWFFAGQAVRDIQYMNIGLETLELLLCLSCSDCNLIWCVHGRMDGSGLFVLQVDFAVLMIW